MAQFEIYVSNEGQYRWRLRATNNEIIADSGESYHNRADCEAAIVLVRQLAPTAILQDLTQRT